MIDLLKTEFLKLAYLRSIWILLIIAGMFGALNTVATAFALDSNASAFGLPSTETTAGVDAVYANSVASYVFALIIGILMFTSEFKHGTAIATFLITPKRNLVLIAKILAGAISGLIVQLVSFTCAIFAGYLYLTAQTNSADPSPGKWLSYLGTASLSGAVLGVVGIGIGALIRNQAVAITSSILWLLIVEGLVTAFLPEIGKYLMSGAITGMLQIEVGPNDFNLDSSSYLSAGMSTLLLIGYGVAFAVIATMTTIKRDIE